MDLEFIRLIGTTAAILSKAPEATVTTTGDYESGKVLVDYLYWSLGAWILDLNCANIYDKIEMLKFCFISK